jgi:hypothetical protein
MMGHREKMTNGAEYDVFSSWRKYLCYTSKPGVCKKIKRQFNKRVRRQAKQDLAR